MLDVLAYALFGLFLLMAPGFLFTLVLYPLRESLDFWERMGVSFGLGVLLLIYVGFALAQPGLKLLEAGPFVGAVFGVCVILFVLAYLRGGLGVVVAYERAAMRIFRKFVPRRPPKSPEPEQPQPPQPEQPQEQAPEQPPGQRSEGG